MKVVEIELSCLREAPWNSNAMDVGMLARTKESIDRYGLVENLVVRPLGAGTFEVLSGNQRLSALRESGSGRAPCVVVDVDDANARLLADALNHIKGEDNLGLRAELLRSVLSSVPERDVLALLPETFRSLRSLSSIGTGDLASGLKEWQEGRASRLHNLGFKLTSSQLSVVKEAMSCLMPRAVRSAGQNPNLRGTALYLLCKEYVESREKKK